MKESSNKSLKHKIGLLYKDMIELKELRIDNYYCSKLVEWFHEVINKNIDIYKSKQTKDSIDHETFKKPRGSVFWIDFGRNIGSEFCNCHFAVVLFESKYTALIVPLTSKKEQDPQWVKDNKDAIVDLGKIDGYPDECKECYAVTFMLQTVSKKRLSRFGQNGGVKYNIKISDDQMKNICDKVAQIAYNKI